MKTLKIIFLVFLTSFFIAECSKNDDVVVEKSTGTGKLTVEGKDYALVEGKIYKGTESVSSPYNFDIDLITSPIYSGTNIVHLVAMEMYTETEADLKPGTYNHAINDAYLAGTFSGIIFIEIDKISEECLTGYLTKSGTILVNKTDSEYEFTITTIADKYEYDAGVDDFVVTKSDVEITCYYKGTLTKDVH